LASESSDCRATSGSTRIARSAPSVRHAESGRGPATRPRVA
jgi:hypothetical protein